MTGRDNLNGMRPAAPFGPSRDDDRQLTVLEPRARRADLESAGQAHRPRKTTELPLDEMIRAARIAGSLRSGDQHHAIAKQHAQRIGLDAGDVEDDFDPCARLEHVEYRVTFARIHAFVWREPRLQIREEIADVVAKLAQIGRSRNEGKLGHRRPSSHNGTALAVDLALGLPRGLVRGLPRACPRQGLHLLGVLPQQLYECICIIFYA